MPTPDLTPLGQAYAAVDAWLANWMDAHPDETREALDILLSADYCVDSPYWPEDAPCRS